MGKKKATYVILHKHKLIIEYYSGDITIDDIKINQLTRFNDDEFDQSYKLLIDFSESSIMVDDDELNQYILEYKSFMRLHGIGYNDKTCFITDKPEHVVFAKIGEIGFNETNVDFGIFSTITASLFFLQIVCCDMIEVEEELLGLKR